MNLFKNDIKNDYIEIINTYFNEWSKIKNAEEHKKFYSKIPPKFGTYKNIMILDQINNFIDLGVQIECNKIALIDFKDEINKICEDLQVYY